MIATCSLCSFVFDVKSFQAINSPNVIIDRCSATCPRCGCEANLLDGHFSFNKNGVATLLSGPQFTKDVLEALKGITEKAIQEEYSYDQFVERAQSVNPLFKFLKECMPSTPKEFLSALGWLLAIIIPLIYDAHKEDKPSATYNVVINFNQPEQEGQKRPKPKAKKNTKVPTFIKLPKK